MNRFGILHSDFFRHRWVGVLVKSALYTESMMVWGPSLELIWTKNTQIPSWLTISYYQWTINHTWLLRSTFVSHLSWHKLLWTSGIWYSLCLHASPNRLSRGMIILYQSMTTISDHHKITKQTMTSNRNTVDLHVIRCQFWKAISCTSQNFVQNQKLFQWFCLFLPTTSPATSDVHWVSRLPPGFLDFLSSWSINGNCSCHEFKFIRLMEKKSG